MTDTVIRVENLGKEYRIGKREGYRTLRDSISETAASAWNRLTGRHPASPPDDSTFWALRDVSFEVKQGEVVGIIGRNGAGKSTLLKILSQITEPTAGRIELTGRVGSLLEVGTGFHPELTGRENIYLNGAILGMKRTEIARKFDEIVAFAEVEQFIDTQVKHYSSGMYMRLAFAVAAHLEPEVLVVDEVLAVGDAEFQKKCLGKMGEVARAGRTVLFVSHNMAAVNRLCNRVVWLESGNVRQVALTSDVVGTYLLSGANVTGERLWNLPERMPGNGKIRLRGMRILDSAGKANGNLDIRFPFDLEMEIEVHFPVTNLRLSFRVLTDDGVTVFTTTDQSAPWQSDAPRAPGRYFSRCRIPSNLLNVGNYFVTAAADFPFVEVVFFEEHALGFQVEQTGGVSSKYPEKWPGIVCPQLDWQIHAVRSTCCSEES